MEEFTRTFESSKGDVYQIILSEDYSAFSPEVIGAFKNIAIYGVELRRLEGKNTTGHEVLEAIERTIFEFFENHTNTIICYYCDYINPIPHTSKNSMPSQEYRSRLFDRMFQRYTKLNGIKGVCLSVVEVNGINEKYYLHLIYKEEHSSFASMIGKDLKDGFDK